MKLVVRGIKFIDKRNKVYHLDKIATSIYLIKLDLESSVIIISLPIFHDERKTKFFTGPFSHSSLQHKVLNPTAKKLHFNGFHANAFFYLENATSYTLS